MITAAIISTVGVAVIAAFSGGFRVYERTREYARARTDILFSAEKLERDLRSMFAVSTVPFIGDAESVSFAGMVNTGRPGETAVSLGRVIYYLEKSEGALMREQQPYHDRVFEAEKNKYGRERLAEVSGVGFAYYYYDPLEETYKWEESWKGFTEEGPEGASDVEIPIAVRIRIGYISDGREMCEERLVMLPLAVPWKGDE